MLCAVGNEDVKQEKVERSDQDGKDKGEGKSTRRLKISLFASRDLKLIKAGDENVRWEWDEKNRGAYSSCTPRHTQDVPVSTTLSRIQSLVS